MGHSLFYPGKQLRRPGSVNDYDDESRSLKQGDRTEQSDLQPLLQDLITPIRLSAICRRRV